MLTENSFSGFKPACHNDNNNNNNNNNTKIKWINNNNTKAYIALNYLVSKLSALHNSKKPSKKLRRTNDI